MFSYLYTQHRKGMTTLSFGIYFELKNARELNICIMLALSEPASYEGVDDVVMTL